MNTISAAIILLIAVVYATDAYMTVNGYDNAFIPYKTDHERKLREAKLTNIELKNQLLLAQLNKER